MKTLSSFVLFALTAALVGCSPTNGDSNSTFQNNVVPASGNPPADDPTTTMPPTLPPASSPQPTVEDDSADPLLDVDLLKYQQQEVAKMTAQQVVAKNEATMQMLYQRTIPEKTGKDGRPGRVTAITPELAQKLIDSMGRHPVVSPYADSRYEQPGTNIGYCFGRATYAHLALLKMGVAKESIRKVWIVGPMFASGIHWAFHVAVVTKTTNGKWMMIDNYTGRLLEIHDWFKVFSPMNKPYNNLRMYITTPAKFAVGLGKYDPVQLGLNLPADQDWYRHYFYDLMQWFQKHDMSEVGLPSDLRQVPLTKPEANSGLITNLQ